MPDSPITPPGFGRDSGAVAPLGYQPAKGHGRGNEFYPLKKSEPKVLGDKAMDWRDWRDSVIEYFDDIKPGFQGIMKFILGCDEPPDLAAIVSEGLKHDVNSVAEDKKKVYRAIKKLTEGVAKQVVTGTRDEDGT